MAAKSADELTLSVRLIWPVARMLEGHPVGDEMLAKLGLTPAEFVDPETRVSFGLAVRLFAELAERLGDPLVGLRAGEKVDFADFDILEHAARSAPNLGEGQRVMWQYMGLLHDGLRFALETDGGFVLTHYRWADNIVVPPAVNDFTIACALSFSRRNTLKYVPPVEVRFRHEAPAYADQYEQYLQCPVVFGATDNTIVMRKERLLIPMRGASPALSEAFEQQARRMLEKLRDRDGVAGRVHADLAAHLGSEPVSMERTAKRLALGVATLRRKLQEQGTSFSEIVDDLRRDLAERYLRERTSAIGEIAFLLGFSDVRAFGRAFKRWTSESPSEYRAKRST